MMLATPGTQSSAALTPLQFPQFGAVLKAKPVIRHIVEILVHTKLIVRKRGQTVILHFDESSWEEMKISAGKDMVTGLEEHVIMHPAGSPEDVDAEAFSQIDAIRFQDLGAESGHIPRGRYVVGPRWIIFETDSAPAAGIYFRLHRNKLVYSVV